MTPLEQLNDQLRQRAHAEKEKQKLADRRLTPDERQAKEQEAKMREIAKDEAENALKTLTIQNGQNMQITGQGRGMTATALVPDPNAQQTGPTGGEWKAMQNCDGSTFEAYIRNFVP